MESEGPAAYVEKAPLIIRLEDQHGEGRDEQRAEETACPKLPSQLSFSSPGEGPLHDGNGVEGGQDVDNLEDAVVEHLVCAKKIGISREEDEAVEDLGYERDTCK